MIIYNKDKNGNFDGTVTIVGSKQFLDDFQKVLNERIKEELTIDSIALKKRKNKK